MKDLFGGLVRRQWIVAAVTGIVMAVLLFSAAFAQQAPPGTGPKNLHRFEAGNPPAQFDLVQLGLDYGPGVAAPEYAYGGAAYNTVMAGEITVSVNGADRTYKDGDTWTSEAAQSFTARNSGLDHAVIFSSILLPGGASLSTTKQGNAFQTIPAGPATLFMTRYPVSNAPSPLDLVQAELDQAPGSWTATHTHPGAAYNTVIQGKLLVRADGKDTTYAEKGSWVNPSGQVHAVQNVSDVESRAFTTFLVPRSAARVTTPVTDASKGSNAAANSAGTGSSNTLTAGAGAPKVLPVTGGVASAQDNIWAASLAVIAAGAIATLIALRGRRNTR